MRARLVPEPSEGPEEPRRRDDPEEATDVHDADGASRILCPEHAAGEDELQCRPEGTNEQWGRQGGHGMGNDFDYHFWNNECLLDLIAVDF